MSGRRADRAAAARRERRSVGRFYDLRWVKRNIPIVEVAEALGIERRGRSSAICPFHPDREPSLSFHQNRYRCHSATCGARGDVLDLATGLVGGIRTALDWLSARYPVPTRDPEKQTGRSWALGRAGVGGVGLDVAVRSGLWAALPDDAARALVAAAGMADPTDGIFTVSLTGFARFAGAGRTATSQGKFFLRALGLLSWDRAEPSLRSVLTYRLQVDASACADALKRLPEKLAARRAVENRQGKRVGTVTRGEVRDSRGRFSKAAPFLIVPSTVLPKTPEVPCTVLEVNQGNAHARRHEGEGGSAAGPVDSVENGKRLGRFKDGSGDNLSPPRVGVVAGANLSPPPPQPTRRRRMRTPPMFQRRIFD